MMKLKIRTKTKTNLSRTVVTALLAIMAADFAIAEKPHIANAKVHELSAANGLKAAVESVVQKENGPLWIGYRIPALAKDRTLCCFGSWDDYRNMAGRCCGCNVEAEHGVSMNDSGSNCSSPEPLPYAFVFLRADNSGGKRIGKVRAYSSDCQLDFAGLPLFWLEDVKPEQSVELLTGLALSADAEGDYGKKGPGRQAVMTIALHDTPAADQALEKLIQPAQPIGIRENVVFWLAVERGKKGLELLRKYVKNDPDVRFRKKGVFAFSQSKEPEALAELIGMARNDESPKVRGEAIFWLAQIGGRKEAAEITAAIENDPETEVKKKAVFALSQMHGGDGVPLLINLARNH